MEQLIQEGRVIQTRTGAVPQYKRYLDEMPGMPVQNLWDDLPPINNPSKELLGYPTQKPLALLERIIAASSNPGDVVMDPFCVTGDTLVVTREGLCPIQDVREGDFVLTHTGQYQRVVHRYERTYQGPLLRITRSRSNLALDITPNHPVLAVRAQSCPYDARRCLPRECHYHRQGRHLDCPRYHKCYRLEWIPAGELQPGDWVYYPTTLADAAASVCLPDSSHPNAKPIPAEVPVTPALLEWFGYFAAEGFVDENSVHFANYEDADRIAALGETLFGVSGVIAPTPYRCKRIRFNSRALSRWMEQAVGRGAANKRLPNWIFGLDAAGRRALLRALLRSDGSFRQDKPADASHSYRYASASPTLAHQVMRLLLVEQIAGSFTKVRPTSQGQILQGRTIQVNHPSYQVAVYDAESVNRLLEVTGEAPPYQETVLRRPYDSYPFGMGRLYSIRQIERYEQATNVYNLEVEQDHSYVTATFTVHNCGCGTAICAAEKLGRRWIGIDITHLAVSLMKSRLKSMFELEPKRDYRVIGEPEDLAGARQLAQDDRYQFQYWAVSLIEATPQSQEHERKKGADKGIDGIIPFIDGANRRRETIVVQVKSGHVSSAQMRDLKGVLDREKAAIGLFICLEHPTRDMQEEAASSGFYTSELWPGKCGDHRWPRIQIRTIEDLLAGNGFEIPPRPVLFKQAERVASAPGVLSPALMGYSDRRRCACRRGRGRGRRRRAGRRGRRVGRACCGTQWPTR